MLRYKFTQRNKKSFEADSVEEIAGILGTLESSVQSFLSKNKKGHLTYQKWHCEDRQVELQASKDKALEEKLREEIYAEAKADLEAATKAEAEGETEQPKAVKPKSKPKSKPKPKPTYKDTDA